MEALRPPLGPRPTRVPTEAASMRPSAFTDGNRSNAVTGFNEAVRHRWLDLNRRCFNEAVGFHRRKLVTGPERMIQ